MPDRVPRLVGHCYAPGGPGVPRRRRGQFLSGIFITGPVLAVVLVILRHDGRYGLVLDIQDPFCVGACTWGAIFGLRKYRKVKLPEPKPRRAKE